MKREDKKTSIERALIKKALGYEAREVVEEYASDEEGEKLTKRKVTVKDVPPDLTAAKILLENFEDKARPLSSLSDAELQEEKMRLLALLKEKTDGTDREQC